MILREFKVYDLFSSIEKVSRVENKSRSKTKLLTFTSMQMQKSLYKTSVFWLIAAGEQQLKRKKKQTIVHYMSMENHPVSVTLASVFFCFYSYFFCSLSTLSFLIPLKFFFLFPSFIFDLFTIAALSLSLSLLPLTHLSRRFPRLNRQESSIISHKPQFCFLLTSSSIVNQNLFMRF